jgi:hypothetical protein
MDARYHPLNVVGCPACEPRHAWVIIVSTVRFRSIRFALYPEDHGPPHAHGFHGGIEVIVRLRNDRTVALADRDDAIQPRGAKRSDVRRILRAAAACFDDLIAAWKEMHP